MTESIAAPLDRSWTHTNPDGTSDERIHRRGTSRVRKQVERLTAAKPKAAKPLVVPDGPGTALADCPNVVELIGKIKSNEIIFKRMWSLMYPGQAGAKHTTIKANIRKFSGWNFGSAKDNEAQVAKVRTKTDKWTLPLLKRIADVLDLEHTGKKAELIDRLFDFLASPSARDGEIRKKPGQRKTTKKKKKAAAKKAAQPRAPSAYIVFCNAHRDEVREEQPDFKMTDVSRVLGFMWNELSDDEKAEWKAKAAKMPKKLPKSATGSKTKKRKAAATKKTTKKKAAAKKRKVEEEEDESEEDESESEDESSDDDVVMSKKGGKKDQVLKAVTAFIKEKEDLKMKDVKMHITNKFGESAMRKYKADIKQTVAEFFESSG